ncbi:MAG: efflux RND transporter periplasmic adaptor subunit [Polyangiaceae bacterium]|nr:efflux RND transporter periplasmic adaptor subunit [Polyangiaceae bacterium]
MRRLRSLGAAIAVAMVACASTSDDTAGSSAPSASAPAAVGLCEHGVEENLCPKCHPALANIYKSKSDWCAEHEMPESFCPICHPELKGRPSDTAPAKTAAPSGGAKAPNDGLKVRLKSEAVVDGAGLVTVVAVKAPGKTSLRFPTRLVYDGTRTAEVTASAGGVVRAVAVDLGAKVKAKDLLVTLDSAEVGGDRSKLGAAYRKVKATEDRLERVTKLEKEGIVPQRERVAVELELDAARAEASSLAAELGVAGAATGAGSSYTIKSPIDGVVTKRFATIGKLVESNEALFQIVDPTVLWAEIDIPETSAGSIKDGAEVVVTIPSVPDEAFSGTVATVLPEVDPHTRTVTARVSIKNDRQRLRANMFGQAAILGDTPPTGVTIPRSAIQTVDRTRFVFVKKEPLVYEVRHVTVPSKDGAAALVTDGLEPGEEVVTTGSFLLKTETLKDSIGAGCCGDD